MPTDIEVDINNIIFQSYSDDPTTGHAIYAFDSTYLPSAAEINDSDLYELLMETLMDKLVARLPHKPYSLVVFSSGFTSKDISWVEGIRMYSRLPKQVKTYLQKMYIVHESFFIRTVCQVLKNVMNIKFFNSGSTKETLVHVSSLSELAEHIDITTLRISLNVYLYDYEINDKITVTENLLDNSGNNLPHKVYRQLIFDKMFKRLQIEAPQTAHIFQKLGSFKKVNILLDVIDRRNYIDLSQWDIHSIATVFLHFIKNRSTPIFPIDSLTLPISDDIDYTFKHFALMMKMNGYYPLVAVVVPFFISLIENSEVTKHTCSSLSKCIAPAMCKEKLAVKNSGRLEDGIKFVGNVLLHFNDFKPRIEEMAGRRPRAKSHSSQQVPTYSPTRNSTTVHRSNSQKVSNPIKSSNFSGKMSSQTSPRLPRRLSLNERPTRGSLSVNNSPAKVVPQELPPRGSPRRPEMMSAPTSATTRANSPTSYKFKTNNTQRNVKRNDRSPHIQLRNTSSTISLQLSPSTQWAEGDAFSIPYCPSSGTGSDSPSDPTVSKARDNNAIITESSKKDKEYISLVQQLTLDRNEKIQSFDEELKMRKLKTTKGATLTKFSPNSYSDITTGNKVSRLAELYEERLLGLKIAGKIKEEDKRAGPV
ncbi:HCL568Wp [Eremothecium sinecaudum]|uniref:HCL568Wp n=1 Tax=Eremothecium sinecaudum TaxID=45286 RepID=A0A109UY39_9SACH|nr:HCL568Wp [Eremothecium sinecaudum]AMD19583.1 HCL568Wp [Eremothecium sinecaudum]